MAIIGLNLNVAPAGDFPVYPAGPYDLRVASVEQGTSKEGNPKLQVKFEIVSGPSGSHEFNGRTMVRSYSLGEKSAPFLRRFVDACVVLPDVHGQVDDQALVGRVIRASVTIREYLGREGNDIGSETAIGAGNGHAPGMPQPGMLTQPPTQPWQQQPQPGYAPPTPGYAPQPGAPAGWPQPGQQYAPPPPSAPPPARR